MPLTRAKNREGKLTYAKDFAKGEFGTCEYCGAPVHRKTSPCGFVYMALRDGFEHTHPICKRLVKRRTAYSLAEFDLEKLLEKLPADPSEDDLTPGEVPNTPERDIPDNTDTAAIFGSQEFGGASHEFHINNLAAQGEKQDPSSEADYEYRPCTSLRQIIEDDLLSDLTPGKLIHGKQAKHVFIIPRFLPEALNAKDFQKCGARVIDCCPFKVFDEKQSIHFRVNRKINDEWLNANFVVYFQNETTWKQYVETLFQRIKNENGTLSWKVIPDKRALIAANWIRSKAGFSYFTQYRGKKQIYIYNKI